VNVNLASNDSRLADLDRNVLSKLPRVMPHVTITYAESSTTSLFGGTTGANYGLTTYTYGGKEGVSRATTAREVLPLIEALDGRTVTPDPTAVYPGYPLASSADGASVWFYGVLPLLALAGWWYTQRAPSVPPELVAVSEPRRLARWPWLSPYIPVVRTTAMGAGSVLLAMQLIPYGRSHTNFVVAPPPSPTVAAVAPQYCPTTFAPGTESVMTLGALRAQVGSLLASLDGAQHAAAANDAAGVRANYGQFAANYAGVSREDAELYPVRCPRLIADRLEGDAAVLVAPNVNLVAAVAPIAAVRAGLTSISTELNTRIQQASPDALVGNPAQIIHAPETPGAPPGDRGRASHQAAGSVSFAGAGPRRCFPGGVAP